MKPLTYHNLRSSVQLQFLLLFSTVLLPTFAFPVFQPNPSSIPTHHLPHSHSRVNDPRQIRSKSIQAPLPHFGPSYRQSFDNSSDIPPSGSVTIFLRRGDFESSFEASVDFESTDVDENDVIVNYTVVSGREVLTSYSPDPNITKISDVKTQVLTLVNRFFVKFNELPGPASLQADFINKTTGEGVGTYITTFHVIGVVIYSDVDGKRLKHTGKNAERVVLSKAPVTSFKAAVYEGVEGDGNVRIDLDKLRFEIESGSPLQWSMERCAVTVDDASKLKDDCSFGFSRNYDTFWVRKPSGTSEDDSKNEISIVWEGLQRAEIEAATFESVPPGEEDLITIFYYKGAEGGSLIAIVAGSTAGALVALLLLGCFVCLMRTRHKALEFNHRTLEGKVRMWIGGYVSSVRTTRAQTEAGAMDDALSEGEFMAAYGSHELHRKTGLSHTAFGSDRSGVTAAAPTSPRETDLSFPVAEDDLVDGLVPLDRLEQDKSVTKLVVPRVQRGVELESSTDCGSDRDVDGDLPSETDDAGNAVNPPMGDRWDQSARRRHQRRAKRRAISRANVGAVGAGRTNRYPSGGDEDGDPEPGGVGTVAVVEPGQASGVDGTTTGARTEATGTDATTGGAGTVVVDDTRADSRTRGGVHAVIDRVRQVDLLSGPATRGLVGRNGEPIGSAVWHQGGSSSQQAGLSGPESKREVDSAIVSLSTLS